MAADSVSVGPSGEEVLVPPALAYRTLVAERTRRNNARRRREPASGCAGSGVVHIRKKGRSRFSRTNDNARSYIRSGLCSVCVSLSWSRSTGRRPRRAEFPDHDDLLDRTAGRSARGTAGNRCVPMPLTNASGRSVKPILPGVFSLRAGPPTPHLPMPAVE